MSRKRTILWTVSLIFFKAFNDNDFSFIPFVLSYIVQSHIFFLNERNIGSDTVLQRHNGGRADYSVQGEVVESPSQIYSNFRSQPEMLKSLILNSSKCYLIFYCNELLSFSRLPDFDMLRYSIFGWALQIIIVCLNWSIVDLLSF